MMTESAARKIVEREIKSLQSETPSTLLELSEMLSQNRLYEDIYIGSQKTEDENDVAIFLGSKIMLERLNDTSEIIIESTSRVLFLINLNKYRCNYNKTSSSKLLRE